MERVAGFKGSVRTEMSEQLFCGLLDPHHRNYDTKFGTQHTEAILIRTTDIRKLSDFRQNATAHLDRLAECGGVEVLTVNGEAKGVVMAPHVYDEIADRIEQLETTASIRRGFADVAAGRTRPARQAIKKLAAELGLKPKQRPA